MSCQIVTSLHGYVAIDECMGLDDVPVLQSMLTFPEIPVLLSGLVHSVRRDQGALGCVYTNWNNNFKQQLAYLPIPLT